MKKRVKSKKGKPNQANKETPKKDPIIQLKELIEYLHLWRLQRDQWKFQKVKQIRLIKGMFYPDKVPDKIFPIFVEYMKESVGNARNLVIERANAAIKETEDWINLDEDEQAHVPKPNKVKYNRARMLLQSL